MQVAERESWFTSRPWFRSHGRLSVSSAWLNAESWDWPPPALCLGERAARTHATHTYSTHHAVTDKLWIKPLYTELYKWNLLFNHGFIGIYLQWKGKLLLPSESIQYRCTMKRSQTKTVLTLLYIKYILYIYNCIIVFILVSSWNAKILECGQISEKGQKCLHLFHIHRSKKSTGG